MMRKQILWNSDWLFARGDTPEKATPVTLPHTWNAKDGQDGGNDYYRGTCLYTKAFAAPPTVTARRSGWNLRALP